MCILCYSEDEVYLAISVQLKGGDAVIRARKGRGAIRSILDSKEMYLYKMRFAKEHTCL